MRLFWFYATRTVKNQIKKLCKTWVVVFFAVCLIFGLLIGMGAAFLSDLADENLSENEEYIEEVEEEAEELPPLEPELVAAIAEAAVGGLFLLILIWEILSSGKSGTRIFQMADVNLLFSAPMKPQSVLLFRLCTQLGAIFCAMLYFGFQIPNLMLNLGVGPLGVVLIFGVLILVLCYAKLINIMLFTAASVNRTVARGIYPLGYGLAILTAGGFALYYRLSALTPWEALLRFFHAPAARWIPVWGWMKGLVGATLEGNALLAVLFLCLLLAGIPLLAWAIWHLRADFYEDALQQSTETAELLSQAQTEGAIVTRGKKKARSEKLRRDGLSRGMGAGVLFTKSLYNRFRFAFLGVFTKTAMTYLVTAVAVSILLRQVMNVRSLIPVAFVIGGFAFFRSLGNPIANEVAKTTFWMIPESSFQKIWMCLLAGSTDCLLDMLPAFFAATILLGANPLVAILLMIFVVSIDLYSSTVGAFIDLSLSVGLNRAVRSAVQILFVYFGLLPNIALLILGGIFGMLPLFVVIAALFNFAVGIGIGSLCPLFLMRGRR